MALPGAVILNDKTWTAELTRLLGVKVHLNDHFTACDDLKEHVKFKGLLVFSLHNSDRDFEFEDDGYEIDPSAE